MLTYMEGSRCFRPVLIDEIYETYSYEREQASLYFFLWSISPAINMDVNMINSLQVFEIESEVAGLNSKVCAPIHADVSRLVSDIRALEHVFTVSLLLRFRDFAITDRYEAAS